MDMEVIPEVDEAIQNLMSTTPITVENSYRGSNNGSEHKMVFKISWIFREIPELSSFGISSINKLRQYISFNATVFKIYRSGIITQAIWDKMPSELEVVKFMIKTFSARPALTIPEILSTVESNPEILPRFRGQISVIEFLQRYPDFFIEVENGAFTTTVKTLCSVQPNATPLSKVDNIIVMEYIQRFIKQTGLKALPVTLKGIQAYLEHFSYDVTLEGLDRFVDQFFRISPTITKKEESECVKIIIADPNQMAEDYNTMDVTEDSLSSSEFEEVTKLRLILDQCPLNLSEIRAALKMKDVQMSNAKLRTTLATHFPDFEIGNEGVVVRKFYYEMIVKSALENQCPITLGEIRNFLKTKGSEMNNSRLRSLIDTHFPEYSITNGIVHLVEDPTTSSNVSDETSTRVAVNPDPNINLINEEQKVKTLQTNSQVSDLQLEAVAKLRLIFEKCPLNMGEIRALLKLQAVSINNVILRKIIETEFPELMIGDGGVVDKKSSHYKLMVESILKKQCPITLGEIRKLMNLKGIQITNAKLRSLFDAHFRKYTISNGEVMLIQSHITETSVKKKPVLSPEMKMVQDMLVRKCPLHSASILAQLQNRGVIMSLTDLKTALKDQLPKFCFDGKKVVRNEAPIGKSNEKPLSKNLSQTQGQLRLDQQTNHQVLRYILTTKCPIQMSEVRKDLKLCGITMNNKVLRATLQADLPEFKILEGGIIIQYDDNCSSVLQSILHQGCLMNINDVLTELTINGIDMKEANLKMILKTNFPTMKIQESKEFMEQDEEDTSTNDESECSSVTSETQFDVSSDEEVVVDPQISLPRNNIELIQSILDEKCPLAVTQVRMTLLSHSIALNRASLRDVIVKEIGDYFIIDGCIYLPTSVSPEGFTMASVVLEALNHVLTKTGDHSIESLVNVLTTKGIEISGKTLEKIISEYSCTYKCKDGVVSLVYEKAKEKLDPKSLEEIVMCLKSLEHNENNSFIDANQRRLFKKSFLEDIFGELHLTLANHMHKKLNDLKWPY